MTTGEMGVEPAPTALREGEGEPGTRFDVFRPSEECELERGCAALLPEIVNLRLLGGGREREGAGVAPPLIVVCWVSLPEGTGEESWRA